MLRHVAASGDVRDDKLKNKNKLKAEQTEVDEQKKIMHTMAKAEAKGELVEYGVRPAFFDRALKKAQRELARACDARTTRSPSATARTGSLSYPGAIWNNRH
jgi:hypothetical protein